MISQAEYFKQLVCPNPEGKNNPTGTCRGCVYSYAPELYDGGCRLPILNKARAEQLRIGIPECKPEHLPGCKYPDRYGCRGCEYNEAPSLFDGGCMISHPKENKCDFKSICAECHCPELCPQCKYHNDDGSCQLEGSR